MTAVETVAPGVLVPRDRVAGGQLVAGHCAACAVTAYPAPDQCPGCLGPLADQPLRGTGILYSYSVIHIGPSDRAVPYTVGYVDTREGARLFGHVDETDEAALCPDLAVRLELRDDEAGYRALWVPAEGSDGDA